MENVTVMRINVQYFVRLLHYKTYVVKHSPDIGPAQRLDCRGLVLTESIKHTLALELSTLTLSQMQTTVM